MRDSISFQHLETPAELQQGFQVMRELRPHLYDEQGFVKQLTRQQEQSYRLLAAIMDGEVVGLAGYRLTENLLYGKFIYVDDLVITAQLRGSKVGGALLAEVRAQAIARGCNMFVLDTGLHMAHAQRFYFRQGLLARGMHFVEPLQTVDGIA
ncbi:GNAT family N-acetyltransferase [Cupriavidus pampae]|uniref:Aminoalkylphosphonate N-acetyltransferase n=1 Tax=Cupriavidus pampae TaxID=659251 RepID=A0ABN7Y1R1_9BURK|nr:GNAT family N-acetyltransferase [Cupriavidus pampae]CAG9165870.1 Aminoalkylphosphonate N-acetyltransferase [Cupriavidus pampae]